MGRGGYKWAGVNIVGRGGYKWAGVNKSGQGVTRVNSKVAKKDLTCPTDT